MTSPKFIDYTATASMTEEGRERERAYYEALGRFVHMFAKVESVIAQTLWHYAKTQPKIAKVVFSGTRVDIGSRYIKQIAEATSVAKETHEDLTNVIQQLGIINGARNDILHYGATGVAEGKAIVSDILRAKGDPTEFPISPKTLDDMTNDCGKIIVHLGYRHLGRPPPLGAFGENVLAHALSAPWRYKHRARNLSPKTKQEARPDHKPAAKPLRQRQPSRRKRK